MSRIRRIKCTPIKRDHWYYYDLTIGDLFRYTYPTDEQNIYMKTNNPDYCLHLPSGNLFTIDTQKEVVPYKDELTLLAV